MSKIRLKYTYYLWSSIFCWILMGWSNICQLQTATLSYYWGIWNTLQWRHSEHDGVSNHQPHDCLLNRLFRHKSKKTSKLRVTDLCAENSPVTSEFPAYRASNTENVSIWWRHHDWPSQRNSLRPSNAIGPQGILSSQVWVMASFMYSTKPLPGPMMTSCQFDLREQTSTETKSKSYVLFTKIYLKMLSANLRWLWDWDGFHSDPSALWYRKK